MCIFAGGQGTTIQFVGNTNIFARLTEKGTQLLVYAMTVGANDDLAMILPLPVPPAPPEDAVRFINLEAYPNFFDALRNLFQNMLVSGSIAAGAAPRGAAPLKVHDVGAFDASFVPTLADFARLDPRFTLPPQTWAQLPAYADWGFAVFKLKGFSGQARKRFHPMAFEFPTRQPDRLFFPTVHVHDGQVHETADFNHELYCQVSHEAGRALRWAVSSLHVATFIDIARAQGIVDPERFVYRCILQGKARNEDFWATP